MIQIDLVLWSNQSTKQEINWQLGEIFNVRYEVKEGSEAIKNIIDNSAADLILFWDSNLGPPDSQLVKELSDQPLDIWHAGLKLGTTGQPTDLNYIASTWTFIRDAPPEVRSMNWRLSLHACLIRTRVLIELGQIDTAFETLDAAGLEMGYRYIWRGAMIVHEPRLVNQFTNLTSILSISDRYLFIGRHFHKTWNKYVCLRRLLKSVSPIKELKIFNKASTILTNSPEQCAKSVFLSRNLKNLAISSPLRISILIPTISRYEFLEHTLNLLQSQTLRPWEVVIVDQTPLMERHPKLYQNYPELKIQVIWMEEPGQCSARNAGLAVITGDLVLFLDDDILIKSDYIENLLNGMLLYQADIVQGVWDQSTGQAIAVMDRHFRMSDRFASGNGMASRRILSNIGGFDLNYNRNYRADADLGMRLYLSGATSVIVPGAKEHSLSPPTGGLKVFGASGAMQKIKIFEPWPAVTQVYYWLRYLDSIQVVEALIISALLLFNPQSVKKKPAILFKSLFLLQALFLFPFRMVGLFRSLHMARQIWGLGDKIPKNSLLYN